MVQFFISGPGTLQRLAGKLPGTKPIVAAVAYATRDDYLPLGAGDDITVNASLNNVLTGATDPSLIERWLELGVSVSSHDDLHAKVITRGNWTAVGSTNLSDRANRVEEAIWLGNDPSTLKQAQRFLRRLKDDAVALDSHWVTVHKPHFATKRPHLPSAGMGRRPRSILPVKLRRLVLMYGVPDQTPVPKYVEVALGATAASARFQSWACQVGSGSRVRPGDLLVWIDQTTGEMDAPVLVTSRPQRGSDSPWAATIYDTQLKPARLAELSPALRSQLNRNREAVVDDSRTVGAILSCWGLSP